MLCLGTVLKGKVEGLETEIYRCTMLCSVGKPSVGSEAAEGITNLPVCDVCGVGHAENKPQSPELVKYVSTMELG